ncbi:endonuclease domain-containing 1 protein-like [Alosa pseudoharengus]|uniref:endonuclease domain-containing 1 protein-like n=1 Tax=Alosa pseudoharengus TaxID=34774 RepID=UPI003F893387
MCPLPQVCLTYQQICQKHMNKYRYATLYDTTNRIPVYSAYKYVGYAPLTRSGSWMIEPQLDNPSASALREMTNEASSEVLLNLQGPAGGAHQAVSCDYENTGYQKGHVYSHCHNCDKDQAEST